MTQEPIIRDCACGKDHWTMPLIDVYDCSCFYVQDIDPDCDHTILYFEGVCRKHKRHIPCRTCDNAL